MLLVEAMSREPGKPRVALSTGKWGCEPEVSKEHIARTHVAAKVLEPLGHTVKEVTGETIRGWKAM